MKLYKLAFYTLVISFIWISCGSDETAPEIEIISPVEGTVFKTSQTLTLEALITDNEGLDFVAIGFTGPNDSTFIRKVELAGDSQMIYEIFELSFNVDGFIFININAVDDCGNEKSIELIFEYKDIETGYIDMNIRLQYNEQPLVMFEEYEYPDGKKIDFTRCSFYISEMKLDETTISEVDFHNLTNSHADPTLALSGYSWRVESVPVGEYNNLSFNIGVPEELNNLDPGDFPSGHPLAKPAENWFSWMSYIFLKVEGNVDLTGDEDPNTGVALHTGSNEALRNISIDYPVEVKLNEGPSINLVFDIYQLFEGPDRIYSIEENPQIHSLDQLDAVIEISNNLANSIHKN